MEKKVVLIPDIHGRTFWKDAEDYIKSEIPVVFLGDYTDPYIPEDISKKDSLDNFKEILEVTKDRKNVELLLGNHDIAYMFPEDTRNRHRTDFDNFPFLQRLFQDNIGRFKLATLQEGYIISHAGIHKEWLDFTRITKRDLIDIPVSKLDQKIIDNLEVISYYRDDNWGGEFGSIVWADICEFVYNQSEDIQIVGHSLREKPVRINNVIDIDCKKCFFIDGEGDIRDLKTEEVVL